MNILKASVVIPAYNQFESLKKVLYGFSLQTLPKRDFELIIIDDGSSDDLRKVNEIEIFNLYGLHNIVVHQKNCGRAKARNVGVKESNSNIIIFCDSDRVPKQDFLEQHLIFHFKGENIVIGSPFDYFGKADSIAENGIEWINVQKYSRLPLYYKKISSIYNSEGITSSCLAWLSFLVGNSSVNKELLNNAGGFNEIFTEWGFEHFEMALRMQNMGYTFSLNPNASSYHIPHARPFGFYNEMINKNIILFSEMYNYINYDIVEKLLKNNVEIAEAEEKIFCNLPYERGIK